MELSTTIHVIFTLVWYIFWFEKPLSIQRPTLVKGDEGKPLASLMAVCSFSHLRNEARGRPVFQRVDPDVFDDNFESAGDERAAYLRHRRSIAGFSFIGWKRSPVWSQDSLRLTPLEVNWFRQADRALKTVPNLNVPRNLTESKYLTKRIRNFPRSIEPTRERVFVFALASLSYAASHIIAWNHVFASSIERTLWRTSTVIIATSAISAVLVRKRDRRTIFSLLFAAVCVAHMMSRIFLIVESLRDVLNLPPSAFEMPVWTMHWPHFA